jgi:hypothetical protein
MVSTNCASIAKLTDKLNEWNTLINEYSAELDKFNLREYFHHISNTDTFQRLDNEVRHLIGSGEAFMVGLDGSVIRDRGVSHFILTHIPSHEIDKVVQTEPYPEYSGFDEHYNNLLVQNNRCLIVVATQPAPLPPPLPLPPRRKRRSVGGRAPRVQLAVMYAKTSPSTYNLRTTGSNDTSESDSRDDRHKAKRSKLTL